RRPRRADHDGRLVAPAGDVPVASRIPRQKAMNVLAMRFQSPSLLWLFALLPVVLVLYLVAQRRRVKYAARFTNVDLLATVVTKSPNWRRHVPPLIYGLALSMLILALGRPIVTSRIAQQQATVML